MTKEEWIEAMLAKAPTPTPEDVEWLCARFGLERDE